MKQSFLFSVFVLLLLFFSCSKEPQENFEAESNESGRVLPSVTDYRIDSSILMALQKETFFLNAVSIDNQKRIIEKSNRSEPVVRTDLLLMKPDDFIYLCEKYDCNVTPYLISELGKTAAERSAFLLKDEVVETKSQIDVIASCQAVKSLVVSKIAEAYQWAREKNHISKDCDCSSANTYMSQAISNLEYMLMATYPATSGEWKLYRKIYELSSGFQRDVSGMSMSDEEEFVNLVNLDVLFTNLKGEITMWGNSVLPNHLTFFVTCHKTHTCPVCGEVNCNRNHTSPDPDPDPDPGEGGDHGGGGTTPSTPCEYCGSANCTGECVADIKRVAPQAIRIFKIDRSISVGMWEQLEFVINSMLGGDVMVDYLAQTLREKINLTLSYNGGCKNIFLTNTISISTRNAYIEAEDFIKSLFHIYQYQYYREYAMSYAMNLEFEAETYLYLSNCILAGNTTDVGGCPVFDDTGIENRYKAWIEECVYIFENNYGIGIQGSDYVDFLMSYSNATHAGDTLDEYEGMQVDTSKEMLAAMFSFLMETRSRL